MGISKPRLALNGWAGKVRSALAPLARHWIRSRRRRRSVVFLHHSYYHFFYLARALRKRGWDAITVSLENPGGPNYQFYHGEDVNLYSADPEEFFARITNFYHEALTRFRLLHFAGDGLMSFFPEYFGLNDPPDILKWHRQGNKVAYTVSGCNSATSQKAVAYWSTQDGGRNVCDKCVWQTRPDICNDEKSLAWGRKVEKYCDLVFAETLPALDYMGISKAIREPTTMCLDPDVWHPNIEIPDAFRLHRKPGELLIYHAVGNYHARNVNGRNIKGTPAVFAAIERLQKENFPIRPIFFTNVKNTEIRYYQAQADIVIDQLNMGRYGANAREAMMLGRPTICYINQNELHPRDRLACLQEVPLVSATEESIYEVLKGLVQNASQRQEIAKRSRDFAVRWHGADACAERYERYYDLLMQARIDAA